MSLLHNSPNSPNKQLGFLGRTDRPDEREKQFYRCFGTGKYSFTVLQWPLTNPVNGLVKKEEEEEEENRFKHEFLYLRFPSFSLLAVKFCYF